jgi:plastocyanin
MGTTEHRIEVRDGSSSRPPAIWRRLLVTSVTVVAVYDLAVLALIGEVVPPLLAGIVLTALGVGLLPRFKRSAIGVLGGTSLLLLVAMLPFAAAHLPHPSSPIDFTHAVISLLGRATAAVAAFGAWREIAPAVGRRLATLVVAMLAASLVVSGVAVTTTVSDRPTAGDVVARLADAAFPATLTVQSGGAIHLDNRDRFRHTYTVPGTSLDVELPATTAVRFTVDLAPGTYDVICDIPGHEFMSAQLIVE